MLRRVEIAFVWVGLMGFASACAQYKCEIAGTDTYSFSGSPNLEADFSQSDVEVTVGVVTDTCTGNTGESSGVVSGVSRTDNTITVDRGGDDVTLSVSGTDLSAAGKTVTKEGCEVTTSNATGSLDNTEKTMTVSQSLVLEGDPCEDLFNQ